MLSSMEERFKQEEAELLQRKREMKSESGIKSEDDDDLIKDEDLDSQIANDDDLMSDEEAQVSRDVNLPSSLDSKLWRLKVKNGLER